MKNRDWRRAFQKHLRGMHASMSLATPIAAADNSIRRVLRQTTSWLAAGITPPGYLRALAGHAQRGACVSRVVQHTTLPTRNLWWAET